MTILKRLEEAIRSCSKIPRPWQGEIILTDLGFLIRIRYESLEHTHLISWHQMEHAKEGINPLLFGIAHCKKDLQGRVHVKNP